MSAYFDLIMHMTVGRCNVDVHDKPGSRASAPASDVDVHVAFPDDIAYILYQSGLGMHGSWVLGAGCWVLGDEKSAPHPIPRKHAISH